jgi:nitrogen fixation/metabolism regulation signal transduction histidine kinase
MKGFTFERKIVLTLLAALLIPLCASAYLVWDLLDEGLTVGLNPRMKNQWLQSLEIYKELFRTQKKLYAVIGLQLSGDEVLNKALAAGDTQLVTDFMEQAAREHPELLSVEVERDGRTDLLWSSGRDAAGAAKAFQTEQQLKDPAAGKLVIRFSAPARLLEQLKEAQENVELYSHVSDIRSAILRNLAIAYVSVFGALTVIVIILGIRTTRRFVRPLAELAAATERVRKGDLAVRVEPRSDDEVGRLAASFNRMVREMRENRGRIVYLEKISSWQEIARRLAHEIKNPLTPINLAMQELHAKYPGGDDAYHRLLDQSCEIVEEEISALKRMVEAFSSFAKLPAVKAEPMQPDLFIADFLEAHKHFRDRADVSFFAGAAGQNCKIDRVMFRRVLDNLVMNAVESAGRDRAAVKISTSCREGLVEIAVEDGGPGMTAEVLEKVFNPYFTTKKDGTGLGLPTARKIVIDHGGEMSVASEPGKGARFTITLPAISPGAA